MYTKEREDHVPFLIVVVVVRVEAVVVEVVGPAIISVAMQYA